MASITFNAQLFQFLSKTKDDFEEEFYKIPNEVFARGQAALHPDFKAGTSLQNLNFRNRFSNIIANDQTRVKLDGYGAKDDDGYINANFCLKSRVIVGQGPLADGEMGYAFHHRDFFDMIWQNKIDAILMLIDYSTGTLVRCSQYLGAVHEDGSFVESSITIADKYVIQIQKAEGEEAVVLRNLGFRVHRLVMRKGEETHELTHYYFPHWIDGDGVDGKIVLKIAKIILQVISRQRIPLVHCNAGIGHSGVVVAMASIIEKIQYNEALSNKIVPETLKDLREERRGLVRTLDEYISVYNGLKSYFEEEFQLNLPPVLKQQNEGW